ncbi:MAG: hypothetical protein ACO4AU_16490 [bacterium]
MHSFSVSLGVSAFARRWLRDVACDVGLLVLRVVLGRHVHVGDGEKLGGRWLTSAPGSAWLVGFLVRLLVLLVLVGSSVSSPRIHGGLL